MFKHGKKILLGAGVLAALSFGGSALASAGAAPVSQVPVNTPAQESTGVDHDQVQSGDQSGPDTAAEAPGTEKADGLNGKSDAEMQDGPQDKENNNGAADAETQDGSETGGEAGSQEASGSEVPGNDGRGGHADEPGNPNANHQASGQQE